jgi:hypothetical protein
VWDLAERYWPERFAAAAGTSPAAARNRIRTHLAALGITATPLLEQRLFLWTPG